MPAFSLEVCLRHMLKRIEGRPLRLWSYCICKCQMFVFSLFPCLAIVHGYPGVISGYVVISLLCVIVPFFLALRAISPVVIFSSLNLCLFVASSAVLMNLIR